MRNLVASISFQSNTFGVATGLFSTSGMMSTAGGWSTAQHLMVHFAYAVLCLRDPVRERSLEVLVNAPFTKWHHKSDVLNKHQGKLCHAAAFQDAELFIRTVENPQVTLPVITDKISQANIEENRHILRSIAEAVLYCGRQCIPLRGDNEGPFKGQAHSGNPGNFVALLKVLAGHDERLKAHLENPKLKNATYLSPQTQNEMIDVIGKRLIQASIVQEVKDARFFTVMVDEVTSHNVELMPL